MARADSLIKAAIYYAGLGWAVFPLRGKVPAISKEDGGHGYLDASTNLDCIRSWWEDDQQANIGIATRASRLLVLDVDPRKGGNNRLETLEAKHGPLPKTPGVVSGGGGRHIYFRAPEGDGIQRKSEALGAGLDLPNYVVAPPSVHPETQRTYRWVAGSHPGDIVLAETPTWLLALLTRDPELEGAATLRARPPGWLGLVYQAIITHIEAGGGRFKTQTDGGIKVRCPLHDDHDPSLSIHPEKGWKCFSGCGEGRLTNLAVKLGISIIGD